MDYKNKIDEDGFYQSGSTDVFNSQLTDEFYLFLNAIDGSDTIDGFQRVEINENHINDFLWFYNKGADIAILSYNGNDFLHLLAEDIYAPLHDFHKVISAFKNVGAGLENISSSGDTPLTKAIFCRNKQIVRELISHGADVNSKNSHFKPLEMALYNGDVDIAYLLSDDLRMTFDEKEVLLNTCGFFNNIKLSIPIKERVFQFVSSISIEPSSFYNSSDDNILKSFLEKVVPFFKNKDTLALLNFEDKKKLLKDNIMLAEKYGYSKNTHKNNISLHVLDKLLEGIDLRLLDFFINEGIDLSSGFSCSPQNDRFNSKVNALQKAIMLSDLATVDYIVKNNIQDLINTSNLWNSFSRFNEKTIGIYDILKEKVPTSINDIKNDNCFMATIIIQSNRSVNEYLTLLNKVLSSSVEKNKDKDFAIDFSWQNKSKSTNLLSLFLTPKNLFESSSHLDRAKYCKVFSKLLKTNAIKNTASFNELCLKSSSLNIEVLVVIKDFYGHFDLKKSPELEIIMTNLILKNRNISDEEYAFVLNNVDSLTKPMCMHMIAEINKVSNKSFDDMMKDTVLDGFIKKHKIDFSASKKNKESNEMIVSLLGYESALKCLMVRYNLDLTCVIQAENMNSWQQKAAQKLILEVEKIHLQNDVENNLVKKKNNFKV